MNLRDKQYWINVYAGPHYGFAYVTPDACEDGAFCCGMRRLYRIHVRLK